MVSRDEIIQMAREAGLFEPYAGNPTDLLERFAHFVAAAERRACAELCELKSMRRYFDRPQTPMDCADAIRARGAGMTEQERRALFFKVTGQVYALTSMSVYSAFCKGLEAGAAAEREACALICDHEMDNALNLSMKVAAGNCADKIRAREQS